MANIKSKVYEKIVTILDKFSDRLKKNADAIVELREYTDKSFDGYVADLAALRQEYNNAFMRFESTIQEMFETGVSHNGPTINGIKQSVEQVKIENDKREAAQTLRDQNNVQSLVNLRESTQKGFDQVRKDVEQLLKLNQRLNERVGQVEWPHMVGIEKRVGELEGQSKGHGYRLNQIETGKAELPSDHVWLNKKLTGVYDTTADLEARVREMEQFLKAFREYQKAVSLLSKI